MKKLMIACGVALVAMSTLVGCNKSGAEGGNDAFGDSLSVGFGQFVGTQIAGELNSMDPEEIAKMGKDEILRGIKEMVMLDTTKQGYMAGLQVGMNLQMQLAQMEKSGIKIDRKKFYDAFVEYFNQDSISTDKQAAVMANWQKLSNQVSEKMMAEQKRVAEEQAKARQNAPETKKNLEAGKKFIADAKAKDAAIKTTASGLAYKVEKEGTGASPAETDVVDVIYTGKLVDGTVFDSSEGKTRSFQANQVIPGWTEALKMMKKGSKYTLYIPAELAYGFEDMGVIKPGSTLVFDVELVDFKAPEQAKAATVPAN